MLMQSIQTENGIFRMQFFLLMRQINNDGGSDLN